MNSKKQKVLWWESCNGDVSREAQMKFDELLKWVTDRGVKGTLVIELTITPPDIIDGTDIRVSQMSYAVKQKLGKPKAIAYNAQVNNKYEVVSEGESISSLLQEELRFNDLGDDEAKTVSFKSN